MMSENLSSANLSPANSNRNSLYFSSVFEVYFDMNTIGHSFVIDLPLVSTKCIFGPIACDDEWGPIPFRPSKYWL